MQRIAWRVGAASLLALAALASGCASITGSESQAISVETHDASGPVAEAECRLSNDGGTWTVKTPGVANVRRSAQDLLVRCVSEDREPGTVRVASRVNPGLFGNVVFGGAIGAVIDHTRGTGYDYPTVVRIMFGMHRVIDGGVATTVPELAPAAAAPPPRPSGPASMEDLEGLLKEK